LILFVGVSPQGRSIILMASLVKNEEIASYKFALGSWKKFGFNEPQTVLTDQDPS